VLSPEQAKKLLEVAKGSRLEALLTLALLTGMQRGELLALRWADINLEEAHLLVNHTVNRIGKRLQSEVLAGALSFYYYYGSNFKYT
jgi:integrase